VSTPGIFFFFPFDWKGSRAKKRAVRLIPYNPTLHSKYEKQAEIEREEGGGGGVGPTA